MNSFQLNLESLDDRFLPSPVVAQPVSGLETAIVEKWFLGQTTTAPTGSVSLPATTQ